MTKIWISRLLSTGRNERGKEVAGKIHTILKRDNEKETTEMHEGMEEQAKETNKNREYIKYEMSETPGTFT